MKTDSESMKFEHMAEQSWTMLAEQLPWVEAMSQGEAIDHDRYKLIGCLVGVLLHKRAHEMEEPK